MLNEKHYMQHVGVTVISSIGMENLNGCNIWSVVEREGGWVQMKGICLRRADRVDCVHCLNPLAGY